MLTRRALLELATVGAAAAAVPPANPPFTLPKLPYAYDALEPYIDAQTMQIHHDKHHQAYVDNLNKVVAAEPALAGMTVDELLQRLDTLPAAVRTAVRDQGGGHAKASLLWETLGPARCRAGGGRHDRGRAFATAGHAAGRGSHGGAQPGWGTRQPLAAMGNAGAGS